MRVLALDWGSVRIGAALSDEGGSIAFPLQGILDSKSAISEIKKLVDEKNVEKIIVGHPKNLNGEVGASGEKTVEFVNDLKKVVVVPIVLIDERFSSVEATNTLAEQGMNEKNQRQIKDNIAAQLILQQYLDNIKLKK